MNNNKISNPKKEVPSGINLNDKDYITSLLICLKDMEKNYVIAMTEASNEHLYNEFKSTFDEIAKLQRDVYELMFRCGWYQMECAENQKISQKLQMLNQEISNLSM